MDIEQVLNRITPATRAVFLTHVLGYNGLNDVLLASSPQRSMAMPEEIAALALFLCRDEAKSITGANYSVDGGWTAQ
jgi:NAD(P)-dependent dehydrogenase (short-subunit alcohol dehydrogenase family)